MPSSDWTIQTLVEHMTKLEKTVLNLQKENKDLRKRDEHRESELLSFARRTQRLDATVANLTDQMAALLDKIDETTHQTAPVPTNRPDTYTQFTSFACVSDIVTLSCPNNRDVFVTSAYYGKYHDYESTCDGCCPPMPQYDCTVLIEDHRPSDWLAIKALCDNQTSCQFENFGSVIDDCEEGYLSDYAQIFYDCYPEDEIGPVGFTAWANTGSETVYSGYDIVIFDVVTSNFGGHYSADTSSFVCPYDGVYLVSVNILAYLSNHAYVAIMQNDLSVAYAWADDQSGVYNQASSTVVIECQRGDVLWIRSVSTWTTLYAFTRRCTFSVYLLHRL